MIARICTLFIPLFLLQTGSSAQNGVGKVQFLKNGMDDIVSRKSIMVKLADGFGYIDGPMWHPEGYLLFSDLPANVILKYAPGSGVSTFLENSGTIGSETIEDEQGSKGLAMDISGDIIISQRGARQLASFNEVDGALPLARHFQGRRLNSPDYVVVMSNGAIYFSDSYVQTASPEIELSDIIDYPGVFRLKNRNLEIIDQDLKSPHGLALSPNERQLYVADKDGENIRYYLYELDDEGSIKEKKLFFDASGIEANGDVGGVKVDRKGNCYFVGPGGILVVNPKGVHLGTITPPEQPSNMCWGGEDGKTLYMTCQSGLYAIDVKVRGAQWKK